MLVMCDGCIGCSQMKGQVWEERRDEFNRAKSCERAFPHSARHAICSMVPYTLQLNLITLFILKIYVF